MWWHGTGWGPMYGWWPMPLFGLVCMIIFLYGVSRIFGRGFCAGQHPAENPQHMDQLIQEVRELRAEIKALKENKKTEEAPL